MEIRIIINTRPSAAKSTPSSRPPAAQPCSSQDKVELSKPMSKADEAEVARLKRLYPGDGMTPAQVRAYMQEQFD